MSMIRSNYSVRQKGFTLIEMSIVLVIIGLIIGGILKGQEIIESSRQKNLITQIDSVRSAVTTFDERYRALPGDFGCAQAAGLCGAEARLSTLTAVKNGNGDGVIGAAGTSGASAIITATTDAADGENLQFWIHLNLAKLVGGNSPINAAPTTFGDGSALPATAIPGSGLSVTYGGYGGTINPVQAHWLIVHKDPGGAVAALTPKQMFELDTKTDDGLPAGGTFRTSGSGTGCGLEADTTVTYTPAVQNINCVAFINLIQ